MLVLADALVATNIALAAATFCVAAAAVWSGLITRAGIERQLVANARPFVFPWLEREWAQRVKMADLGVYTDLPIKNGGRGPAFNLSGAIYWAGTAGGASAFEPTALAVGEEAFVEFGHPGPNFNNARGYIRYTDEAGVEWLTHFAFAGTVAALAEPTLRIEIVGAGRTADLGEPQYNADAWVNAPASEELRWGAKPWRGGPFARWVRVRLERLERRARELEARPRGSRGHG